LTASDCEVILPSYETYGPNAREFMDETIDKIQRLHMFDCLRANKATSAWGVEAREPFLDVDFVNIAMNLDPNEN
jgi:asparagine synthase (glutamine-hydrolysing)